MGLLKIFFILFFAVFPLGQFTRIQLANSLALNLTDLSLVLIFVAFLIYKIIKKRRFQSNILKPVIIFISIAFLSLIINFRFLKAEEFFVSFLYIARFILYFSTYLVILEFDLKFKKKIPFFMLISGFALVVIGFIQYLFYPNLRNLYYLGWDEHQYRMFSSFLDPNFAGSFFVIYFLFSLTIFLLSFKKSYKFFILIPVLFSFSAIFLTFSRSALLMLIASSVAFTVFLKKTKYIFILGSIILLFIFLIKDNKIENMNIFRIASSEARIESAKTAVEIIKKNPFLGVGFNAYRYAQVRYGFRDLEKTKFSHADAGTDNSFLFVIATTGFIGFFAFIYLLRSIIVQLSNNAKSKDVQSKYFSILAISTLIGLFINSFFINSLFYPFIIIWIWMLLGLSSFSKTE